MNRKEAENLLIENCEKYKVSYEEAFQFGCATKAVGDRYKHTTTTARKNSHCYAIKYFPYEDVYIAWNLWEGCRGTTNFSVRKKKIKVVPGQIFKSQELIGHNGSKRTRIVYAFQPECLGEFVQRYVARTKART